MDGSIGAPRWSCSCGDGGDEKPESTIDAQIESHFVVTAVPLLPRLNQRQLVTALRRRVADRAPAQRVAVDLLITH
ncbi:hypothetical protein ACFQS1_34510 [Paractinoplanes rhizophilus]|uniref:Uncharacterized protein n=1 Tax=Paractinoplanes rhizophilus TaxID=1416877 RepID=A0ABW2I2L9_9ACTN